MKRNEDVKALEAKLDHRIDQLKSDQEKLDEIGYPETLAVENFDYVPIVQEVIKGESEEAK